MATRELPLDQRRSLRNWMRAQLTYAGYLSDNLDGSDYLHALADRAAISYDDLRSCVFDGNQLEARAIRALALALGMHPLPLAYRSGYLSDEELALLIGSGRLSSLEEIQAQLASAEYLPEQMAVFAQDIRQRATRQQHLTERLVNDFDLQVEEFGGVAATIVLREIHLEHEPIEMGNYPPEFAHGSPPGSPPEGVRLPPPGAILGRPGPTRFREAGDMPDSAY